MRELHFVVNEASSSNEGEEDGLNFECHRCAGSCFNETVEALPVEEEIRYWSDPDAWGTKTDENGDEVSA